MLAGIPREGLTTLVFTLSCFVFGGQTTNPSLLMNEYVTTDEMYFGDLRRDMRSNKEVFRKYSIFSLLNCVTECLLRRHCKSFNYHRGSMTCELIGSKGLSSREIAEGYVFSRIESWPKVRKSVGLNIY